MLSLTFFVCILLIVFSRGDKHWVLVVYQDMDADVGSFTDTQRDTLFANEEDATAIPYCRLGNIDWDNQPSPYSFKLNWWDISDSIDDFEFEFTQTSPLDTTPRAPTG